MLRIRLSRTGAKKKPTYRIVVSESARTPTARNIEIVGHYNPRGERGRIVLDLARVDDWIRKGARPSVGVLRLINIQRRIAATAPPAGA